QKRTLEFLIRSGLLDDYLRYVTALAVEIPAHGEEPDLKGKDFGLMLDNEWVGMLKTAVEAGVVSHAGANAAAANEREWFKYELVGAQDLLVAYQSSLNGAGEKLLRQVRKLLQGLGNSEWSENLRRAIVYRLAEVPSLNDPRLDLLVQPELAKYLNREVLENINPSGSYILRLAITESCNLPCAHCSRSAAHGAKSMLYLLALQISALLKKNGAESITLYLDGDPIDYFDPYFGATLADIAEELIKIGIRPVFLTRGPERLSEVARDTLVSISAWPDHLRVDISFLLLYNDILAKVSRDGSLDLGWLQPYLEQYREVISILAPVLGEIQTYPTLVMKTSEPRLSINFTNALLRELFGNAQWSCSECRGEHNKPLVVGGRALRISCCPARRLMPFGRGYFLRQKVEALKDTVVEPEDFYFDNNVVINVDGAIHVVSFFSDSMAGRLSKFFPADRLLSDEGTYLPGYFSSLIIDLWQMNRGGEPEYYADFAFMVVALAPFYDGASEALREIRSNKMPQFRLQQLRKWYKAFKDLPLGVHPRTWPLVYDGKPGARFALPVRAFGPVAPVKYLKHKLPQVLPEETASKAGSPSILFPGGAESPAKFLELLSRSQGREYQLPLVWGEDIAPAALSALVDHVYSMDVSDVERQGWITSLLVRILAFNGKVEGGAVKPFFDLLLLPKHPETMGAHAKEFIAKGTLERQLLARQGVPAAIVSMQTPELNRAGKKHFNVQVRDIAALLVQIKHETKGLVRGTNIAEAVENLQQRLGWVLGDMRNEVAGIAAKNSTVRMSIRSQELLVSLPDTNDILKRYRAYVAEARQRRLSRIRLYIRGGRGGH
ncbi:MAG: hypothetical protein HGA80_09350, partial [Candidatus Omnitrophica bacterium]|nr:hypothetical protein [Candidatus Omnitrophota bacterium]